MELYIFDRNLDFQGIIDEFTSLQWTRRYYTSGEFELQCVLNQDNLQLLQRDNIIYKKDDSEAGYIEYRNLKQDTDGKEILVVKGKFLTSYLNRRIIWGTEIINNTVENAMRTLVNDNCINPTDSNRIIPNLVLGDLNNFIETTNYQVSYSNLLDELNNLSNLDDLGYRVLFDINDKKLIFNTYKGLDRSINQSANPIAIFSKEFENILEQEYVDSADNLRNFALVGGIGEGAARKLALVGDRSGLDRFELFVDQKDLQNVDGNNNPISDSDYINLLITKGWEALNERKPVATFDSKINVISNLKYKIDFDLGDIVTCTSQKWSVTLNTRITEIKEIYEASGLNIDVTFGNNIPTIIDKIKQNLR